MQKQKMLAQGMPLLKPWAAHRDQPSVDAVAVDGGLVIGLFEKEEPLCYIVTDGEKMHKYASVTSHNEIRAGHAMRWTSAYVNLTYTWKQRISVEGEKACRSATGMSFDQLVHHLEASETAAAYCAISRTDRTKYDAAIAEIVCVLQMAQAEKELPKTFYAWALETMRKARKRVMTAHVVRTGVPFGGPEHLCVLQYEVRRTGDAINPVLERIGICGENINMQLGKNLSIPSWVHPYGWMQDRSSGQMKRGYVFPSREVRAEFAGTAWARTALWTQCRRGEEAVNPLEYAQQAIKYRSVTEQLTRVGCTRLAMELNTAINTASTQLCGALGITRQELRMLREMNAGADDYKALRKLKKMGETKIDAELIELIRDTKAVYFTDEETALIGKNARRTCKYVIAQEKMLGYGSWQIIRWMVDGRRMEKQLHVPPIEWPKDVKRWHDTLANMQKAEEAATYNKEIAKQASALEYLNDEIDGIAIRPLRSGTELFEEGKALEHCVASYAARYAEGRSLIFCARIADAPDVPLVTFEVRDGRVRQIQGRKDRITTPEEKAAKAAVEKWAKRLKTAGKGAAD